MIAWRNRAAAAAAAVAFAIGTLAVPMVHLVFHALPHDHEGGEIHYHLAPDEDHEHHDAEGEDHEHHDAEGEGHEQPVEAHEHEDRHADDHEHEPFDPHHGEGSAAHFSLALSDAPAATIDFAFLGFAEQGRVAPASDSFHASARGDALRYRGPPVIV
jgi:hypothetical protein